MYINIYVILSTTTTFQQAVAESNLKLIRKEDEELN